MQSVVVQHSVGCAVAAPPGGCRARTAPGSGPGAGGADRPQPPANALSMLLTALSTARGSGQGAFWWEKRIVFPMGIRGDSNMSRWFNILGGVRQGCV